MINYKKMDDKDFVFINKRLNEREDKAFSEFLKRRRKKHLRTKANKKLKELKTPIVTSQDLK